MQQVPKDIRIKIALELSPPDLIHFCATERKQNRDICNSETFWRLKLEKDYPEEFLEFYQSFYDSDVYQDNKIIKNPKERYIYRFTEIAREIEKFYEEFVSQVFKSGFNDSMIRRDFKKDFQVFVYKVFEESLNYSLYDLQEVFNLIIAEYLKEPIYKKLSLFLFQGDEDINPYDLLFDFISNLRTVVKNYMIKRKQVDKIKKLKKLN